MYKGIVTKNNNPRTQLNADKITYTNNKPNNFIIATIFSFISNEYHFYKS